MLFIIAGYVIQDLGWKTKQEDLLDCIFLVFVGYLFTLIGVLKVADVVTKISKI